MYLLFNSEARHPPLHRLSPTSTKANAMDPNKGAMQKIRLETFSYADSQHMDFRWKLTLSVQKQKFNMSTSSRAALAALPPGCTVCNIGDLMLD